MKSATASTLCGVPVAEAARRLGLDPSAEAAVWADGEARTTTNARVFPVRASAADAVAAALETRRAIKKPAGGAAGSHHGGAPTTIPSASSPPPPPGASLNAGLRVSIAEALRVLADHAAALDRRDALREDEVAARAVATLLARDTPAEKWLERAKVLKTIAPARGDHRGDSGGQELSLIHI